MGTSGQPPPASSHPTYQVGGQHSPGVAPKSQVGGQHSPGVAPKSWVGDQHPAGLALSAAGPWRYGGRSYLISGLLHRGGDHYSGRGLAFVGPRISHYTAYPIRGHTIMSHSAAARHTALLIAQV